jgi:hypothetical protein
MGQNIIFVMKYWVENLSAHNAKRSIMLISYWASVVDDVGKGRKAKCKRI